MVSKIRKLAEYYYVANRQRQAWFSGKFRLFVSAVVATGILLVYYHLQSAYSHDGTPIQILIGQNAYLLYEKLFNWFIAGMFFGILAAGLLFEGEFILGIWKTLKHLEKGTTEQLGPPTRPPHGKARKH
ncbi:MAG TPA: hypothetical protein VGQ00_02390 [Candidatus Norongarragalinales archaeon]|jgi:hypothetical protein|nr:hypothetical protein [Candidatus Norongarragalinales archaeon]